MSNVLKEIIHHLDDEQEKATPVKLRPVLRTLDSVNAIAYIQSFIIHFCNHIFKRSDLVFERLCRDFIIEKGDFYEAIVQNDKISYPDLLNLTKKNFSQYIRDVNPTKYDCINKNDDDSRKVAVDHKSICNKRHKQEDRLFAVMDLFNYSTNHDCQDPSICPISTNQKFPCKDNLETLHLIGLLDGHNGPEAAEHCQHIAPLILSQYLQYSLCQKGKYNIVDGLGQTFYLLNTKLNGCRNRYRWKAGCTCTLCIVSDYSIFTAWVGDSSAWLVFKQQDSEVPLTNLLHRPTEGSEVIDVWNHGGIVTKTSSNKFDRVDGVLAVTRALGDDRKIPGVSPLPSVSRYDFPLHFTASNSGVTNNCNQDGNGGDQRDPLCIVLGSDGLWDSPGCNGNDVGKMARQYLLNHKGNIHEAANALCQALIDVAVREGATDNISIVILTFPDANAPPRVMAARHITPDNGSLSSSSVVTQHQQNIHQVEQSWGNRRISMYPEQLSELRHCSGNLANYIESRFHTDTRMIQSLQHLSIHTPSEQHSNCSLSYQQKLSLIIEPNDSSTLNQMQHSPTNTNSGLHDNCGFPANNGARTLPRRARSVSPSDRNIRFSSPIRIIE